MRDVTCRQRASTSRSRDRIPSPLAPPLPPWVARKSSCRQHSQSCYYSWTACVASAGVRLRLLSGGVDGTNLTKWFRLPWQACDTRGKAKMTNKECR